MMGPSIPVLHVSDSHAAEEFYCGRLGFSRAFVYRPDKSRADPCYMGVARDGAQLHLSSFSGDGVPGSAVYVMVQNVDALHAELVAKGVSIDTPPIDQTWGMRELFVRDADRNRLQFGQALAAADAEGE